MRHSGLPITLLNESTKVRVGKVAVKLDGAVGVMSYRIAVKFCGKFF